jgi:predicted patatin/cPLA2 family phospholipase
MEKGSKPDASGAGKTALVLEGGGMRGVYTTGVLDRFLDEGLFFDYIIGVSAGASHAVSYIARQKGRARRVNVEYCRRADYLGPLCLIREGSLFGMDLLFKKIPFLLDPFDFERFTENVREYYAVATDLESAAPAYLAPRGGDGLLSALKASCSLPFVSPPVPIGGRRYLDGGVADSIPVRKALADGCDRLVVVLTQPKGFRKPVRAEGSLSARLTKAVTRLSYAKTPRFADALLTRAERYNETLDFIDRLEATGQAIAVRPEPQPGLARLERDPAILNGLYRSGYADAKTLAPRIREALVR